jgi:deoxyhypusine synthase
MATVNVGNEFVEKISMIRNAVSAEVPVVVVRIADGKFGLQGRFLC